MKREGLIKPAEIHSFVTTRQFSPGGFNSGDCFLDGRYCWSDWSPSRIRVKEACKTGANVLAVACPTCAVMLSEAIKDEGIEEKLIIKDISEIVKESAFPLIRKIC